MIAKRMYVLVFEKNWGRIRMDELNLSNHYSNRQIRSRLINWSGPAATVFPVVKSENLKVSMPTDPRCFWLVWEEGSKS